MLNFVEGFLHAMPLLPISAEQILSPPRKPSPRNTISSAEMETSQVAAAYMADFENIIAPGKEVCMTKEFKPRMAQEFERYHNPQSLKQSVLRSEKMRQIVENYARESQCLPSKVEKQVKDILQEIGLERNLSIIRWCGMAITAIAKRIYSGIYVNKASIDRVKRVLGPNPVLYLPSHRSYMDFILMAYITFYYDIELPGVAAGMDFHSMFAMGTMLRKTGAFFMRRSFSNDELYWDVFREYMYALVATYHTGVEFFIEGTRSRNFKALVPKIGLLSMALLPYFAGEVSGEDLQVIPVSVSYERVLEEQLFVYELLGVPKPKESTKAFFKAMKIIDEKFGKMYLDFGTPISVREFFGHNSSERSYQRTAVGAHRQKLNKSEIELVKKLANEVIYQQQRGIVITTFNLISLYYACESFMGHTINIDEITRGITQLKNIFEALGAHVATDLNRIKLEIMQTVEIHSNILHFRSARLHLTEVAPTQLQQEIDPKRLKAHALSPHTMAIAVPAVALQLYINPCLFWLARPAYMILATLQLKQLNYVTKNCGDMLSKLFEQVCILDNIFKHEFVVESGREADEFQRHLQILQSYGVLSLSPDKQQIDIHENECSRAILSTLAPYLCIYYQLTITLNNLTGTLTTFTSKDILIHMQKRIEELLQENDTVASYVHPYCLALDNITVALNSFIQNEYIIKDKDSAGQLRLDESKSLKILENQLLEYCKLMPFYKYYEPSNVQIKMNAKL